MKSIIKVLMALSLVAGLFALVGCGGNGTAAEDFSDNFVGVWDLYSMEENGQPASNEDIEMMKDLGMTITLTLNADGSVHFDALGSEHEGTWVAKDATTVTITIDGTPEDMTLEDGVLSMEVDGVKMGLKK